MELSRPHGRTTGPALAIAGAGFLLCLQGGAAGAAGPVPPDGGAAPVRSGVAPAAYLEGPPPGYTGGFGEETCYACHAFEDPDDRAGGLSIAGLPERYAPGEVYPLVITLTRPGIANAGFQMTARFQDGGEQAGSLTPAPGEEHRVAVTVERGVSYAHHVRAGTRLVAADTARWTLLWTAPAGSAAVAFHVAANGGNEDDSPFGDWVYAVSATVHDGVP